MYSRESIEGSAMPIRHAPHQMPSWSLNRWRIHPFQRLSDSSLMGKTLPTWASSTFLPPIMLGIAPTSGPMPQPLSLA